MGNLLPICCIYKLCIGKHPIKYRHNTAAITTMVVIAAVIYVILYIVFVACLNP